MHCISAEILRLPKMLCRILLSRSGAKAVRLFRRETAVRGSLSIAKNKTLDILKKSNRTCSLDYIGDVGGEDGKLNLFENKTVLDDLLRTLDNKELDIVVLRHIVGLTLTEIAKEKDMKKGTVFWMYNRAVKKLRLESERMGLL